MTDAVISMSLPAQSRFVATARVTTASIAAELDFGVDAIEELRVGVNELVALVIEWAEDHTVPTVDLIFRVTADAIEVEVSAKGGEAETGPGKGPLDALTQQILSSVVDDHAIGPGWGRLTKRRVAA